LSSAQRQSHRDTRKKLLEAAEALFIECGYEAMSLRQITTKAHANLAAVNYHFGSKESLMQELLSQRLDQLNGERLQLLSAGEARHPGKLDAASVLGILFIPAFRLRHGSASGPAFMRLLGRVYSDPSPFIRSFLQDHYRAISDRFFEAFSRALPMLPRPELGVRLHFGLKAISGMLAGEDMQQLIGTISKGEKINDAELLARLTALISPILTAPFRSAEQIQLIEQLMALDNATALANEHASRASKPELHTEPANNGPLAEGRLAS
jgi:AcrR family transcriptional regulator